MRVLITGGAGFLGSALLRSAPAGARVAATRRRAPVLGASEVHAVDLADADAVLALWNRVQPRMVIHTAYGIEAPERDIDGATRAVVDASRAVGAALIHVSTDMLLDGEHAPYTEDAAPAPVLEYGRWKARAEEYVRRQDPAAAVVRTSLLTSFSPLDPRSAWVARGLAGEAEVTLFADEIRCPIAVDDVAAQIWEIAGLAAAARGGVWNLAGPEAISRYALGLLVAAHLGLPADRLRPGISRGTVPARPRDLRLSTTRADRELRHRARAISELVLHAAGPAPAHPPNESQNEE